jgi:hypothetical protein
MRHFAIAFGLLTCLASRGASAQTSQDGSSQALIASPPLAPAAGDLDGLRRGILVRAARTSSRDRADADSAFDALTRPTRFEGVLDMADRIAAVLGVEREDLLAGRAAGRSWGDMVIATTLAANLRGIAATDLAELHAEGTSWGRMAAGLGFDLRSAVTAVAAELAVVQAGKHGPGRSAAIRLATGMTFMDPGAGK